MASAQHEVANLGARVKSVAFAEHELFSEPVFWQRSDLLLLWLDPRIRLGGSG
jgi:hypothetical protein